MDHAVRAARIASIDLLRGMVMVLMALDHARYYFSVPGATPEDMAVTNGPLFATRWVTHLCAPAFFFLMGLSVYLQQAGPAGRARLTALRGAWLIVLELTVVGFAWSFQPGWSVAGVIWSLGVAMVVVAGFSLLDSRVAFGAGLALMLGHNLLDGIRSEDLGSADWIWHLLHVPWSMELPGGAPWFVLFPLLPWVGVALLGFGSGPLFALAADRRARGLAGAGVACLVGFAVLRATGGYGNPVEPSIRGAVGRYDAAQFDGIVMPTIAFLNVEKYPASLQFLLMTLGVLALLLAWLQRYDGDREPGQALRIVRVFGAVPMGFYVLHLFVLHLLALGVAMLSGQPSAWLGWGGTFPTSAPAGYGYGLVGVYLAWSLALSVLYGPCARYARWKAQATRWWKTLL